MTRRGRFNPAVSHCKKKMGREEDLNWFNLGTCLMPSELHIADKQGDARAGATEHQTIRMHPRGVYGT